DVLAVGVQRHMAVDFKPGTGVPARVRVGVICGEAERSEREKVGIRTASGEGATQGRAPMLAEVAEQNIAGMAGPTQQRLSSDQCGRKCAIGEGESNAQRQSLRDLRRGIGVTAVERELRADLRVELDLGAMRKAASQVEE